MYSLILIVVFVIIVILLSNYIVLLAYNQREPEHLVHVFNNDHVPYISPPRTIVVDGNQHKCHQQLTPCTTHMDCDLCYEGLANCQYFDEPAVITMRDDEGNETEHRIEPGESFCLALDRNRARSCNPNTGLWLLAETEVGFSLLCSCLMPGVVTQLNMYEDCNVPVGCQPHGQLLNINERPLRCECETGFIADYNYETETPLCRPLVFRDMINDPAIVPRTPCPSGYVSVDHPGVSSDYKRYLRRDDVCVPNPCGFDPLTGQRTDGQLGYHPEPDEARFCMCSVLLDLFPVYNSGGSMMDESEKSFPFMPNACLKPFNRFGVRYDYRIFWARNRQATSDDDIVASVSASDVNERYRVALYPYLSQHPDDFVPAQNRILKFSIAYSFDFESPIETLNKAFRRMEQNSSSRCFKPGNGRCIVSNPDHCIRRHHNFQVWTAERTTGSRCVFTRQERKIMLWHTARSYGVDQFPILFRVKGTFVLRPDSYDDTVLRVVFGRNATTSPQVLMQILDSYPEYNIP